MKVKFESPIFTNLTVHGTGIKVTFENGTFETEDAKEIELLKEAGFVAIKEKDTVEIGIGLDIKPKPKPAVKK